MTDQAAKHRIECHGNGSYIEHPGRSAAYLGYNPKMMRPYPGQQKQDSSRQPVAKFPTVTLVGIAGTENGKDDTSHCKCGQSSVADVQDAQHTLIEVTFGKGKNGLAAKAFAQRRAQQTYQNEDSPDGQQILQPVTAEEINHGTYQISPADGSQYSPISPEYTFLRIAEGKGKVEKNQYADYLESTEKVLLSTGSRFRILVPHADKAYGHQEPVYPYRIGSFR